jgi:hypothetical protein
MLVVLGGCDTGSQPKPAEPETPGAPETPEGSAPDTSAEADTGEDFSGFEDTPVVSGSAAPAMPDADAGAAAESAGEPETAEAEFDMAAAEKVFKEGCTNCHPLARIEAHAKEELEEEPWDEIVTRMVKENGAKISPEDQKTILTYLQAKYKQ